MKKYLYKITALSVALLFSFTAAHADDLKRIQNKTFKVQKGHNLVINTRHSNVSIVKNYKDEIEIDATLEVTNDNRRGRSLFDNTRIVLSQKAENVYISTEFPDMNLNSLEIDIVIKAPLYMHAKIAFQYGNLYLAELEGNTDLNLKYGSFKSNVLASEENKLEMAYMEQVRIGYLNKAMVDISYSEIIIKKVDVISGRSSYSEYSIGEINQLNMSVSKYDEWEIKEIESLVATSRYSEFEINYLKKVFTINANFGDIEIDRTATNFKKIDLNLRYTDCELGIEPSASYYLKVSGSYGDIEYDKNRFKGSHISKMMSLRVNGQVGESPKGEITIITSYADVELH